MNEPGTPDMHCSEFVELVTAYLEGALNPADEQRFAEHLGLCDGCGRYLDQVRHTVAVLPELPEAGLPPQVRAALLTAFRMRAADGP